MPPGILCNAIRMTMRYHLGTLATGSLIIAIIRMMRIALEYIEAKQKQYGLADKPGFKYIMCVLRCCLWCLEKCARWMNKKVYIMTCIKGTWFCTSLCSVAAALFSMMTYISVAEFTSSIMLFFGKVCIGLGTAAIGGYILNTMELTSIVFPTLIIAIIGFAIAGMFMTVYDMAIDTMLMCFCEAKRNPERGICVPKKLEAYMGDQYDKNQPDLEKEDGEGKELASPGSPATVASPMSGGEGGATEGLDPELVREMKEKFARYDLDQSGSINSQEELQQLMTNLYFALSGKGIAKIRPDKIAIRVQNAGDMSQNNWSFDEWVGWCKTTFPEICAFSAEAEAK